MPKPKPTAANAAVLAAVAPAVAMAVIENMSQHDRCLGFFERATTAARTFTELGKLHYAIQKDLKSGEKIYVVLRALAGKDEAAAKRVDSAISNASYASRVYAELVATGGKGALTEAQFDAPNICGGNTVRGSLQAAINGDGRYVVFTSDANIVPAVTERSIT